MFKFDFLLSPDLQFQITYSKKNNNNIKLTSCKLKVVPVLMMTIFSFFFVLVVFKYFYVLNLFLPRNPQDFAENSRFFVCLFPFYWNSNSKNSFVTYQ